MASTTPLPALLKGLNIGVDRPAEGQERKDATGNASAAAAPKLALTDQLHLLSAHIDTLEKDIQARVTSSLGKETIRKQGTDALRVRQRVSDVHSRVDRLESQVNGTGEDDQGRVAFLESLAQYASARNDIKRRERLYAVALLIKSAVLAVEELEGRARSGHLEADELRVNVEKVDGAACLLGLGGANAATAQLDNGSSTNEESFTWLAKSGKSTPKALRDLANRIEAVKEQVREELLGRWHKSICLEVDDMTIGLAVSDGSGGKNTLVQLIETLHSRSELTPLIEKLAHDIFDQIVAPVLSSNGQYTQVENGKDGWKVIKGDDKAELSLKLSSLVSLVQLVQEEILSKAPPSSQATFAFSRVFVPQLVPSLLKSLRSALPSRLERPIASSVLPRLQALSQEAESVHEALLEGQYFQRDLRDEGEEIINWATDIKRHCMKSLAASQRRRARELLLSEAGGGWQAVPVEFEVEDEESEASQRHGSDTGTYEENVRRNTSSAHVPDQVKSVALAGKNLERPLSADATSLTRNSSQSGARSKQKKSALGGRRVVKPQDELGSGPFPESETGDDVSWGFDDDIVDQSASSRAGPSRPSYDALMESLDQEEDVDEDAWGLTEEEKVERAAKRASMRGDMAAAFQAYQASQEKQSSLPQIVDDRGGKEEEDVDDAWGLTEQEQEALNRKRQGMLLPLSASAPGAAAPDAAHTKGVSGDDEDEDAWGLSAQEQEAVHIKRRSMLLPARSAPPTPAAESVQGEGGGEHEDDDDDDAWGLSAQEQEAIARKRQSVLMPASLDMTALPGVQGSKTKLQEDRESAQDASASAKGAPATIPSDMKQIQARDVPEEKSSSAHQLGSANDGDAKERSSHAAAEAIATPRQPSSDFERAEVDDDDDEGDAWGLTDTQDNVSHVGSQPVALESSQMVDRSLPSDGDNTAHSHKAKTSATSSSSFTRTTRPLDMEIDESIGSTVDATDQGEQIAEIVETTEAAPDPWDARDDVLSGSEEAAAGGSRGGKSSGSGEKLSDTTTEPWEEITAPPQEAATTSAAMSATASVAAAGLAASQYNDSPLLKTKGLESNESSASRLEDIGTDKPLADKSARPKEKCVISKRSVSLIGLISETMDDIEAIVDEQQAGALDPIYLIDVINDILDLHRALLPVGHADTLATVPSLGMQFANDCAYIGNRLKEMQLRWTAISSHISHADDKLDFNKQAELTSALGARSFDGQILLQLKVLSDCLVDTEGFTATHEESRMQSCQRSLKQIEFVLRQLQSAWKPVITRSSYLTAMGRLVDGILRRVLLDIEAIEDISEVESEKLAALIKTLGGLDFLFHEDGPRSDESVAALYVTSWFKATYLSEILTGSLVDIEFLYFEAEALVDYSKGEVISLIRSLFADTPKRSRLIDRIQTS